MSYVVIEHTLDEAAGVYRLVVGFAVEREVYKTDENGRLVTGEPVPVLGEDGEQLTETVPLLNADGEPVLGPDREFELPAGDEDDPDKTETVTMPGGPQYEDVPVFTYGELETETVTEITAVEDFLFAANDPRWSRFKGPDTIAAKQREEVLAVLEQREQEAEEAAQRAAQVTQLAEPGQPLG
jgi:hypothetical protein